MTQDEIRAYVRRDLAENPPEPLTDRQITDLRTLFKSTAPIR